MTENPSILLIIFWFLMLNSSSFSFSLPPIIPINHLEMLVHHLASSKARYLTQIVGGWRPRSGMTSLKTSHSLTLPLWKDSENIFRGVQWDGDFLSHLLLLTQNFSDAVFFTEAGILVTEVSKEKFPLFAAVRRMNRSGETRSFMEMHFVHYYFTSCICVQILIRYARTRHAHTTHT